MTLTDHSSLMPVETSKLPKAGLEPVEPKFETLPVLAQKTAPAERPLARVFSSDSISPVDHLGDAVDAAVLAEMIAHKGTQTPMALGLFGGPGSGKSTFVNLILERVQGLAEAAEKAPNGPFLSRIVIARVALESGTSPMAAMARAVYQALSKGGYGALLEEAQHTGRDPQEVAREAHATLGDTRQRLDAERQALHELNGRNARLTDTVLFESAGSRVDSYARKIRGLLEPRLRSFGFESGDPIATFKILVRDVADTRGTFPRLGGFVRSLWAFKGQTKLIVLALLSLGLGWAAGFAAKTEASWTATMKAWPDNLQPAVNFIINRADWLNSLQAGLIALTILFVVLNFWRAIRFFMPISHGVGLLRSDVSARKRDIDGLLTHQTQRVATLAQEADTAAKRAADAQNRARSSRPAQSGSVPAFVQEAAEKNAPQEFLRALNELITARETPKSKTAPDAPQRLVVSFDGFDHLNPQDQAGFEQGLRDILSGGAFASVFTLGTAALTPTSTARLIQVPYDLTQRTQAREPARLIAALLEPETESEIIGIDPTESVFDLPLSAKETALLGTLAEWVGPAPRDVKRFINLYRVARALEPDNGAGVAFALALQHGGTFEEKNGFETALNGYEHGDVPEFAARIGHFVSVTRQAAGGLPVQDMRRALAMARRFSAA